MGTSPKTTYQHLKHKTFRKNEDESFTLFFGGDTSFGENYQNVLKEKGKEDILERFGYDYCLQSLQPLMLDSDYVVLNLETPITDLPSSPFTGKKDYVHWTHIEKTPKCLLAHNVSLVSLANNHAFDYGQAGFEQTLSILKQQDLTVIGAGDNIQEAGEPFIGEVSFGKKVFRFAIFAAFEISEAQKKDYRAYADTEKSGLMPLDVALIAKKIQILKGLYPDIYIIFYPHWGRNYQWHDKKQSRLARELIASGIDLILGHGAHMMQEVDRIDNHWCAYSLGNFMFNSVGRYKKLQAPPYSYIATLNIQPNADEYKLSLKLYPIVSNNLITHYQPRFLTDPEFQDFYSVLDNKTNENVNSQSGGFSTDQFGHYQSFSLNLTEKIEPPKWVGMICRAKKVKDYKEHVYVWMAHAFPMSKELVKHNVKLICYSPANVDYDKKTVTGFVMENGLFHKVERPIPKFNYDFHISPDDRVAYRQYKEWLEKNDYEVYTDNAIHTLARDKLETAKVLNKFREGITPYTKTYLHDGAQIEEFLTMADRVFLKPRYGSMGEDILVISKNKVNKDRYDVLYHNDATITSVKNMTVSECVSHVDSIILDENYIIQEGINVKKYHDSVFDIRVILYNIGSSWKSVSETRLGPPSSNVSNNAQGGTSVDTQQFMKDAYSKEESEHLLDMLYSTAAEIAEYLYKNYSNNMNEISFDFMLDNQNNITIAELNTKPGLLGTSDVHAKMVQGLEDNPLIGNMYKQGEYIAKSLLPKLTKPK